MVELCKAFHCLQEFFGRHGSADSIPGRTEVHKDLAKHLEISVEKLSHLKKTMDITGVYSNEKFNKCIQAAKEVDQEAGGAEEFQPLPVSIEIRGQKTLLRTFTPKTAFQRRGRRKFSPFRRWIPVSGIIRNIEFPIIKIA